MRSLWRRLSNIQRTEPVMATQETDPGTTTMEAQETDRGTAQETNPPAAGNEQTNPPFMDSGTPAAHQTAFDSGFGGSQMTGVGPTNSSHGTDAAYYPPHTGPAGAQTSAYTAYYQHNTDPAEATQILPYQPYLAGAGAQTAYLPLYSAAPGAQTPHVTPYVQAPIILTNMPYSAGNRLQTPVVPAFGIYPPAAESQTAHGLPYAEAPTVLPLTQRPHVPHYPGVQASHMQPNLAGVGVQVPHRPQRPDVQPLPTCAGQQTPIVPPYHAGPGAQPTQPRP